MARDIMVQAHRPHELWHEDNPHNTIGTRYVLTRGIVGDVAAYKGPDVWSIYDVAAMGTKISREHAVKLFGDIITEETVYRK